METVLPKLYFILFFAWMISTCYPQEVYTLKMSQVLDEREVVLFDHEWNTWLKKQYGYERWEPKPKDMLQRKIILGQAVAKKVFYFLEEPIQKNLDTYYRQYVPILNKDGERMILVNAFCSIHNVSLNKNVASGKNANAPWRMKIVQFDDGGDCFWQIKVNLDKMNYSDLMVNGPN